MAGGISEHMMSLVGPGVVIGQKWPGTDFERPGETRSGVGHMEVKMNLLGVAVGPVGRLMIRDVLHTDDPSTFVVDHAVEVLVPIDDRTAQQRGPELADLGDVGRVEHNDLADELHGGPDDNRFDLTRVMRGPCFGL